MDNMAASADLTELVAVDAGGPVADAQVRLSNDDVTSTDATGFSYFEAVPLGTYSVYAFNAPTTWGFEATTFLYGVHYMLGLAYCDVYGGHVRVDIFTSRMPMKLQGVIGVLTNMVFFLPVMVLNNHWI